MFFFNWNYLSNYKILKIIRNEKDKLTFLAGTQRIVPNLTYPLVILHPRTIGFFVLKNFIDWKVIHNNSMFTYILQGKLATFPSSNFFSSFIASTCFLNSSVRWYMTSLRIILIPLSLANYLASGSIFTSNARIVAYSFLIFSPVYF
jgi:hypothetical protein